MQLIEGMDCFQSLLFGSQVKKTTGIVFSQWANIMAALWV